MGLFPLRRYTELYLDGAWVDISGRVYERDPITITRGRGAEDDRTSPASCTLTLDNRNGAFSPRNPRSPYYGLLRRNTPIRVSVAGPGRWLDIPRGTTARAAVASSTALTISADLDVRIDVAPDTWAGGPWAEDGLELIGRYTHSGNQRSWRIIARPNQTVEFAHSTTGADYNPWTSPRLPFAGGRRGAVRVTLDVNNGAGGHTLTWYTADTIAGPWTVLGSETRTGTITLYNPTAPLEVGDAAGSVYENGHRRIYAAEVRNGINGPAVAAVDFTAQEVGATSVVDAAGRTWTLSGGAAITDRLVRFTGEVVSWPQRWDVSGADVYVPIEAAGMLRRLGQGRKPLASTLRRRLPSASPLAYWPLEDADGATAAASGLPGGSPLYTLNLDFGAENSLPGSSALPTVGTGSRLNGAVRAPSPDVPSTEWHIEFVYRLDTAPAAKTCVLGARGTGTVRQWYLHLQSGIATVEGYDVEGNLVVNRAVAIGTDLFGQWVRWQLYAQQIGGTVEYTTRWVVVGSSGGQSVGTYAGTIGRISDIVGPPDGYASGADGMALGHITVFDTANVTAYNSADHGFSGETAIARMARLAREERNTLALAWIDGDPTRATERMGAQRPDTLLDLLEDAAEADGGILYEDRRHTRLLYRTRTTLYNQPVRLALDYGSGREVAPPLEPDEDDQGLRNDVTVQRRGGSWGRAVLESGPLSVLPPEQGGVGLYDEEVELNVASDAQTGPIAGWLLHLGTWDEARYPVVHLALHGAPHLISQAAELDVGDRITIAHPPPWLPPDTIDLLAQGYTETIHADRWDLTLNCSPAGPWTVGVIEDPTLGRVDTDGCTLNGSMSAETTIANVVTAVGAQRWIDSDTYPSQFPFLVRVGGEVMRVNSIVGTALSQTMIVTRGINGLVTSHASGTPVRLAHPMRIAL